MIYQIPIWVEDHILIFFPITYVSVINPPALTGTDLKIAAGTDLQNYYEDDILMSLKASAPITVGIKFHMFPAEEDLVVPIEQFNSSNTDDMFSEYFYYMP